MHKFVEPSALEAPRQLAGPECETDDHHIGK